jgi:UDPglucose--hexose-1-phosphate uridylyltransferase
MEVPVSEIRQNIATKDWVIIATERAKRPEDFVKKKKEKVILPGYSESCPFCPGNERMSPVETCSIREGNRWKVRAIPNKFPAVSPEGELVNREDGIVRLVSGVGIHDVIIEGPEHNLTTAQFEKGRILDIISVYKKRYLQVMEDDRVELVTIFKNHGESAGTSLEHPHSQLVATPVVPSSIRQRIADAMHYYDDHRECVFCRALREELEAGERVILETANFAVFIPYAALSPFHIWIMPKRHTASFPEINDAEMEDFAGVLKTVLGKIYHGLDDPDYNYVIRSLPGIARKNSFFHWYLSIIPRVSKAAGFELGSGMFINTALPEESAKFLRGVEVPSL